MDTIDLDEDLTPDEASAARPYAIEALRELGVQLSENDRSPALAQAWRVLDGMKDRLDRRTRRLIASGGAELTLPRSRTCEDLAAAMSKGNPLIVTGPPYVGKSALTLSALDLLVTHHEAQPTCVSLRDLPATTAEFEHLLGSALVEVLGASSVAKRRVLLIDGGEAVLERRRGLLQDIAAAATDAGLQLVVVTRSDAKTAVDEAIRESVPRAEADSVRLHEVPELADDEVQAVVEAFPILGRIARQPRAKWLIRRLGLVDLVLRSKAVADLDAGGLCEGDVFRAVWFRLVRNREQVTDSGASPDGRAAALVELARRELFPDSEPRPIADVHALASLRSDGLLHDASEAYLGDVSSPLKHSPMMAEYRELEAEWEQAIGKAFGVELWRHHDEVKSADQKAFKLEHTGLLGWESSDGEVARAWASARAVMPEMGLMEMGREKVRVLFVREFEWLGAKRKATVTP